MLFPEEPQQYECSSHSLDEEILKGAEKHFLPFLLLPIWPLKHHQPGSHTARTGFDLLLLTILAAAAVMLCILPSLSRFTAVPGGRCVEEEVGVGRCRSKPLSHLGSAGVKEELTEHLLLAERQRKSFSCCCSPRGPAGGSRSLELLRLVGVFFLFVFSESSG